MTLDEIKAKAKGEADESIEKAYFAGVAEGRRLAKIEMLNLLASTDGDEVLSNWKKVAAPSEPDMFTATTSPSEPAKRAPKGLTKRVLKRVFLENPDGLLMEAVQDAAVAMDSRISRKTVYNELYRRTEIYSRNSRNLWNLHSNPVRAGNASFVNAQPREGAIQ